MLALALQIGSFDRGSYMPSDDSYVRARVLRRGTRRLKRGYVVRNRPTITRHRGQRFASADEQIERTRLTERAWFAAHLDGELRLACRSEAAARRHVGELARELLRTPSYCQLGFVRLG